MITLRHDFPEVLRAAALHTHDVALRCTLLVAAAEVEDERRHEAWCERESAAAIGQGELFRGNA